MTEYQLNELLKSNAAIVKRLSDIAESLNELVEIARKPSVTAEEAFAEATFGDEIVIPSKKARKQARR